MKQNIFLIAVLATLSMVNAAPLQLHKRATTFAACPSGSPTALTVSLQPDPPAAAQDELVNISGTTTSELATGSQLVFSILDGTGAAQGTPANVEFCTIEGITCPVAAGTAFSTIAKIAMPPTLPEGTYSLVVQVMDANQAVAGCSIGTITGADAAPPADGGDAPPPADGGDAPPPADGGDAPPPADGGDAPPPADGGDGQ